MANKVRYGLKNVHYATVTFASDGTPTFGTPVAIPGAVSASLTKQGDTYTFYADDGSYFELGDNASYEGDLVIALIPDSFRTDVLGEVADSGNGLLYEKANALPKAFALLFQFEGDAESTRHVLYYCKASRPTIASQTTEESIEPVTETISITATAVGMTVGGVANTPVVKAKCGTTDSAYSTFFTAVKVPTTT